MADKQLARVLALRVVAAAGSGDFAEVVALLAPDAVLISDGGGKRSAALRPICGADKVARWLFGVMRSYPGLEVQAAMLNGELAFVVYDGEAADTVAFLEVTDDAISTLYLIRNPDKLTGLPARHALD